MRKVLVILFAAALSFALQAQTVPFAIIQPFADNLALGGAHTASPSALPQESGTVEAGIGKTFWQTKALSLNLTNFMLRIKALDALSFGIEYTSDTMAEYETFDAGGNSSGTYQPNEMYIGANVWIRPVDALCFRAAGRYIRSSLAPDSDAQCFAADLAGIYRIAGIVNTGFEIRNLGGKLDYGYGEYPLPTTFTAGAYGAFPIAGKHKAEAALDAGVMPAYGTMLISGGAGYIYNDMIAVRSGVHISTNGSVMPTYFSFGVFFVSKILDIGAAYLTAAQTYSLSARIRL